ncbi:MAG: tRNA(Glu) U13 pseudouridine synthase TruD [Candidatus Methanohalarchaeum thermophilum]|uniref:Probable tRNA pseudouridine synthase D n=1 Tax=Methanohalarchaeum thermophilum TaxID=1903181 RepID=A0A1Q6DXP4_METT1|nr:MAG: tRNA(Glu) U13 pseudouridine synthase TruD [Candidatus Methanohalarchaeum thermophilum]
MTEASGVRGSLKQKINDFKVEEIPLRSLRKKQSQSESGYPGKVSEETPKNYVILFIRARNWDTNSLINELSNQLGISRKRISFAGTKDKRAITYQYISIKDLKVNKLDSVEINGIEICDSFYNESKINRGDLKGNKFEITIRDPISFENVSEICGQINEKGVINYFGYQRFGKVRPITHKVGKKLVNKDFEEAVKIYLTKSYSDENPEIAEARKKLENNWRDMNYDKALKEFPNYLHFERTLLHHLKNNPKDYIGALKKLPNNLQKLFIHAYQSYLFNEIINKRIERGIPLDEVQMGDVVLFEDPEQRTINRRVTERVKERNFDKLNEMVKKNKAYITAPLIGTRNKLATGSMGAIEKDIIEKEDLYREKFKFEEIPYLSSKGLRREILTYPRIKTQKIDQNNQEKLKLKFKLPKGCYATSVTREFRKAEEI